MRKIIDPDVKILRACVTALDRSTSPRMLRANLEFLVDKYLRHPPQVIELAAQEEQEAGKD